MADDPMVKTDQGTVNARILAREAKADFRRVEAASLKMRTHLTSAEAKRLFVRMFHTLQLNAHFISVIARTRIDHQEVEAVEAALRAEIEAAKTKLNEAIDNAEALFTAHGVDGSATYDTQPLEVEVGILSSSGRRYLEVLNQLDQLMPLLQTLEIHEVITTRELDIRRAALKRQIRNIATSARRLAAGLRKRMNAMGSQDVGDSALADSAGRALRGSGAGRRTRASPAGTFQALPRSADDSEGAQGAEHAGGATCEGDAEGVERRAPSESSSGDSLPAVAGVGQAADESQSTDVVPATGPVEAGVTASVTPAESCSDAVQAYPPGLEAPRLAAGSIDE